MATQQAEKAAVAAVQTGSAYWRAAGMTYIWFACRCAVVVRSCLKEPFKSQALSREKVHYRFGKYNDGKQGKSGEFRSPRAVMFTFGLLGILCNSNTRTSRISRSRAMYPNREINVEVSTASGPRSPSRDGL
uniref:Uncharacterized protein n=1 Tax=Physcomitrium patens TaxID=3218 RepID=A0A2K1L7M2_PHYPA|nr:hypothetical protein PHYPA_000469 [Physcomitrium patens]